MFPSTEDTDKFVAEIFNSMTHQEKKGLPGKEKESNVLKEVSRILTDEHLLPTLLAIFGPTRMIPLTIFVIRTVVRILNQTLGHDWVNKAQGITKDK